MVQHFGHEEKACSQSGDYSDVMPRHCAFMVDDSNRQRMVGLPRWSDICDTVPDRLVKRRDRSGRREIAYDNRTVSWLAENAGRFSVYAPDAYCRSSAVVGKTQDIQVHDTFCSGDSHRFSRFSFAWVSLRIDVGEGQYDRRIFEASE